MRLLLKLATKFVMMMVMVLLLGAGVKYGQRHLMKAAGLPAGMPGLDGVEAPKFSSEEADLMSTVMKSALRLFSGSATRKELASDLSDKLYGGRAGSSEMSELGIELVKPGEDSSISKGAAGTGNSQTVAGSPANHFTPAKTSALQRAKQSGRTDESPSNNGRAAPLAQVWKRLKVYSVEMGLVPVVFLGMVLVQRIRRRSDKHDFVPQNLAILPPPESEAFEMKHAVHSLKTDEFELLVALIYQRQGYRVSMPAGLSAGRGVDFTLLRKSERVVVQCKRMSLEHKIPVEKVRELSEAVTAAGATRGLYVASCGFTWDARNFGKANRVTLINARTLDELIAAAREKPDEDLLAVEEWLPKFMSKVELKPPLCPACEAPMDQINVSESSVWLCSQRPDCRGRRNPRKIHKPISSAA